MPIELLDICHQSMSTGKPAAPYLCSLVQNKERHRDWGGLDQLENIL